MAAAHARQNSISNTNVNEPFPNEVMDPLGIRGLISSNPQAHVDPGLVTFPGVRPTLTGGRPGGLQHGTPSAISPEDTDMSAFVPDIRPTSLRKNTGAEQHMRRKIQDLVSTVDSNAKIDADAEEVSLCFYSLNSS